MDVTMRLTGVGLRPVNAYDGVSSHGRAALFPARDVLDFMLRPVDPSLSRESLRGLELGLRPRNSRISQYVVGQSSETSWAAAAVKIRDQHPHLYQSFSALMMADERYSASFKKQPYSFMLEGAAATTRYQDLQRASLQASDVVTFLSQMLPERLSLYRSLPQSIFDLEDGNYTFDRTKVYECDGKLMYLQPGDEFIKRGLNFLFTIKSDFLFGNEIFPVSDAVEGGRFSVSAYKMQNGIHISYQMIENIRGSRRLSSSRRS